MQEIYDKDDIIYAKLNLIKDIKDYYLDSTPSEGLQNLQFYKPKNSCEKRIFQLLLTYINKVETISAGGYETFIHHLLYQNDEEDSSVALTKTNLKSLLSTFVDNKSLKMLLDVFNLIGLKGKIILSQHPVNGDRDVIELNNGSYFPGLISSFELASTKYLNPKIVCIDGFVETVSEINKILEEASSTKETVLLFLRGLSNDVLHTLKVNYDRGSLRVIPIVVKYDLDGINLLNDIAISSLNDVVSCNKGQLINNTSLVNFNRVESVDITSNGILIENSSASYAIDSHIKRLQERITNSSNQYEKDAIVKRVQNLGINRVTIRLHDSQDKKKRLFEIDRAIRAVKNAQTYGINRTNGKYYPYSSIVAGMFYAKKFLTSINDLGAIIND